VTLTDTFKAMTASERLAQARRTDLTENERLALAVFADDRDLAAASLSHPGLSAAAEGVARSVRDHSGPWWRRLFRL
jgi:hypothetical protein